MGVECVVSVNPEALNELEGVSVREDVVSASSCTRGMAAADRFVVRRSKLLGDSANVEPSLVVKVLREGGNLRRDRVEVAKMKAGPSGWASSSMKIALKMRLVFAAALVFVAPPVYP